MGRPKRTPEQIKIDIAQQHKTCCVCEERKHFDFFYNLENKSDGKSYRCKDCDTQARKKWQENNLDRARESNRARRLKHVYGISLDEYNKMFEQQGGKCKICGSSDSKTPHGLGNFAVDHCHETGKIRGLLCNNCNRGLGLLGDTVESLQNAVDYLKQFECH